MSKPKLTGKRASVAGAEDGDELVQIVISNVPAHVAEALQELANEDQRPRAAFIRKTLTEIVDRRRAEKSLRAAA